jgi:alpha-L-rhamnosidase
MSSRKPRDLRTEYDAAPVGIEVARPRFSWATDGDQSAYRVLVASTREALSEARDAVWDSGVVESERSTFVAYDGEELSPGTRYYWKVRTEHDGDGGDGGDTPWSDVAWFETGLPEEEWEAAWIGREDDGEEPVPAPRYRTDVEFDGTVERARAHVAAAGYYELRVNGERVGEQVLDTGHTDYEERVLYAVQDVTDLLDRGSNAIGVELGRDWYALTTENVWGWERAPWRRDHPHLSLQLEVELADGSREVVSTDGSWRVADGPTTFDSIYCGEIFDAREDVTGWAAPGFDDGEWERASVVDGLDGRRTAQNVAPTTVVDRLDPVGIDEPDPGVYVFDFGEVTAGWVELRVEGPAGTAIELTYGERRHDDGTVDVDQDHVEGEIQTDRYVLAGEETETWTPRFSYKGFQYVEVRGFPGTPTADALTAEVVHTPIERGSDSRFGCSDDLLERIHGNARRAFLNNCHSIPTDTPVFEKNGWTGDAQVGTETALYNFDAGAFFTKWLDDFADAQRPDGEVPPIVPTSDWGYSDRPMDGGINSPNPGWDCAYVFVPWWLYEYCGDQRLLETHYEGMRDVVDWTGTYAEDGIVDEGLGDWLAPDPGGDRGPIPPEGPAITSTAFYHRMARTVADAAGVLGHDDDRETYAALAEDVAGALNDVFLDPRRGIYATGDAEEYRQTSNVFPLAFDLVPDDHVDAVVANLVEDVAETHDGHLNTGFHGTKYLLPVLTDHGHLELAYEVATETTYPSWGHWIEAHDATTIYEAWELSSRSRDHYALGAIDEWFYKHLAGIRPAEPGFEHVEIAPHVPDGLDAAAADVDTVRGIVSSAWEDGDALELDVSIPAGVTATVRVPRQGGDVRVDGTPVDRAAGIGLRDRTATRVAVDVDAGAWTFTAE